MTSKSLSRRSFVKAAALGGAAMALGTHYEGGLKKTEAAWAAESASGSRKTYVTTCRACIQACPCRVYVENGVLTKIEGHPYAPTSLGSMCMKGLNEINNVYSPRRVLYPLKRSGPRGAEEMAWERISWEEAIDLAATKIAEAIEKYGTYSFFTSVGGGGSYAMRQAITMAHSLGSPTVFEPGCAQCYLPRYSIALFMYGGADQSIADAAVQECFKGLAKRHYEKMGVWDQIDDVNKKGYAEDIDTQMIVLWGAQPSVSQTAQSGRGMAELRDAGCKTVVVDPNMSPDAVKADVWLRVRPGADGALALSWWNYIIEHKLYNEEFVKEWTNLPFVINEETKLPYRATDIWPDYVQSTPADTPAYVCFDNNTGKLVPFEYQDASVDPEIFWSGAIEQLGGVAARSAGQIYKEAASVWTLEEAERVTWVPADLNEKAILLYTAPLKEGKCAGICHGVASDMEQIAHQLPVGLCGLDAVMGYVNKPGCTLTQNSMPATNDAGEVIRPYTIFQYRNVDIVHDCGVGYIVGNSPEENEARLAEFKPDPNGFPTPRSSQLLYITNQLRLDRLGMRNHKGLYHWEHSHIPTVREAIATGEPYKPRVWFDMSGNKLAMLGNAESWYNVFQEIDFCICQHPMITSFQAEVADLIFPVTEWIETTSHDGRDITTEGELLSPAADTTDTGQLNFKFGMFPVLHLGETASCFVPPKKVAGKVAEILNAKLEAGQDIVLGAAGQATGRVYNENPTVMNDGFLATSKGASYLHDIDRTRFNLRFPLPPGIMFGEESDECIQQSFAERFGAPDIEALHSDPEAYQTPVEGEGGGALKADGTHAWWSTDPSRFWVYDQHEAIANDGLKAGFGTESRKFEVYAQMLVQLAKTGFPCCYPREQVDVDPSIGQGDYEGTYAPICQHIEPAETPVEGEEGYDPEYPLAITSGRVYYTHHGTQRQAPYMRELWPIPDLRMHSKTAEKYGLKHMDWVKVSSRRASTHARVYITDSMHESVVWMERNWNPECFDSSQETKSGGWRECNMNMLTKNTAPFNECYGSYTNRGFCVKVEKSERPERVWVEPEEFEPLMYTHRNQYVDVNPYEETLADGSANWTPVVTFSEEYTFSDESLNSLGGSN